MKKLYFVSGLPRSGSTLLCNVLAQNPRFYASQTSGLLEVLFNIRNRWDEFIEMKSMDEELSKKRKIAVIQSVVDGFYSDVDKPVVFDKSRGWLAHLEMLSAILDYPIRVLVPVRDIRDVLASLEKLNRKMVTLSQSKQEAATYLQFQTVEQRCDIWVKADQPVGLAYNRIKDALQRGWQSSMFFVNYDKFTKDPNEMMKDVYTFLEEPYFEHHFTNIQQVTWENDNVHGFSKGALHNIRPDIKPQPPQYPSILGAVAEKFKGQELW